MATRTLPETEPRNRLSRERVVTAAVAYADQAGLEALSMRKLADVMGVAPMALYRHVSNRDDLIDAMVDVVFAEIDLPSDDGDWRRAMRERAVSVRTVLSRHRWAIGLMESRSSPGPANLRHHDAVIGSLRAAGFDMTTVAHAYSLLDSYIYGYALTKMNLPFEGGQDVTEVAESMLQPFAVDAYPNLVAFITEHASKPGYDYGLEFDHGLDLILDAFERVREGETT